jgi:hypothetical protein
MSKFEDVVVKTSRARTIKVSRSNRGSMLWLSATVWADENSPLGDAYLTPEEGLAVAKALVESGGLGSVVEGELPAVELTSYGANFVADGVYRDAASLVEDLDSEIRALLAIRNEIVRQKEEASELEKKRYAVTESLGQSSYILLSTPLKRAVDEIIKRDERIAELEGK